MEEMARQLGIADRVDFLGRRSRREVQEILARSDIFVDGMRDTSSGGYSRDPFNFEQVEVTKGPSSASTPSSPWRTRRLACPT